MTKDRLYPMLPYIGIPVIGAMMLIVRARWLDPFILLQSELIIIFGYVAAVLDIKLKRITNGLILAMMAAWLLIMIPKLFIDTDTAITLMAGAALGAAIGGGLFLIVYFISRKGLGGGDVKFMAASGLYLGFNGILPSMLFGTVLAAIFSLSLIFLRKISRKDTIPLAPFLYIGILLTVFIT